MKKFAGLLLSAMLLVPVAQATIVKGNPKGQVTVAKYFDYECPHCRTMSPVIDALASRNKDVRIESRVLALMSPESRYIARAVIASREQGADRYERFNDLLMAQRSFITRSKAMQLARSAGLDTNRLSKDMKSSKVTQQLKANMAAARANKINLVPTFLIAKTGNMRHSKRFVGRTSYYRLQQAVQSAR